MAANPQSRPQVQTALDEVVVDDELLEQALEKRQRAKDVAGKARKDYSDANDAARAHLDRHELGELPLRVGRFRVKAAELPARAVAFETSPARRITISVAE